MNIKKKNQKEKLQEKNKSFKKNRC